MIKQEWIVMSNNKRVQVQKQVDHSEDLVSIHLETLSGVHSLAEKLNRKNTRGLKEDMKTYSKNLKAFSQWEEWEVNKKEDHMQVVQAELKEKMLM